MQAAKAPGADAPMRIIAMWVGALICGRMLTWFRPPFTDQPDALPAI
jgi:hypothetical protein